jgi:flagellar biosynthesis component FlhA
MANYEGIIRVLSSVLHLLLPKWSTITLYKEEDIKEEEKEEKEEKEEEEEEEEEDTNEVTAMNWLKKQQTLL